MTDSLTCKNAKELRVQMSETKKIEERRTPNEKATVYKN